MKKAFYSLALGAALLLTTSTASVQAEERDCAVDIKSLCAGITPGGGHVLACMQSHIERTLRRLLVNSVEGCVGRQGVRSGHPALLP